MPKDSPRTLAKRLEKLEQERGKVLDGDPVNVRIEHHRVEEIDGEIRRTGVSRVLEGDTADGLDEVYTDPEEQGLLELIKNSEGDTNVPLEEIERELAARDDDVDDGADADEIDVPDDDAYAIPPFEIARVSQSDELGIDDLAERYGFDPDRFDDLGALARANGVGDLSLDDGGDGGDGDE